MFKRKLQTSPTFFKDYKNEINRENRIQLGRIAELGSSLSAALFVISQFIPDLKPAWSSYLCLFILFIVIYIFRNHISNVLFVLYIMMTACFAFGITAAIFTTASHSTTSFCVFLVALPIFLFDKQWRANCYLTIVLLIYLICGIVFRDRVFLQSYIVDSVSFYFLGLAIYHNNLRLNVKNLVQNTDLRKKVETDSLTELYNRSALEKHINKYILNHKEQAAFILIDVDNFKGINDNFGHTIGDKLLHQTAGILKAQFRMSDYIGRLGGDEFVVFVPQISNVQLLINRVESLIDEMNRTFISDKAICKISGSIGVAMYPQDGDKFEELYKRADEAMYESKKSGKSKYTIYGHQ